MKRVAVLVHGYYPHFDPIGQVFEKVRPFIGIQCQLEFFHLRQRMDEPDVVQYDGCPIRVVSNWLYDLHLASGRLSWLKRKLSRILFLLFYAPRLETKEDNLAVAFCKAVERCHHAEPFDVVMSFSAPLVMHAAARRFKRRHPEVKWVTYSADTTFDNPVLMDCIPIRALGPLYVKRRNALELELYDSADMNLFTPEIMKTLSRMQSAHLPQNAAVVEYPFFDADKVSPDASEFGNPSAINFLYAGGVDPTIRSPDYMIDLFKRLPDEIHAVCHLFVTGYRSPELEAAARDCPHRFRMHKPLPYARMRQVMMAADVLVSLGNNSNAFSPSKIYDYFSTGLPILSFVYAGRDKSEIFDRYPNCLELENFSDAENDAKRLAAFCSDVKGKRIGYVRVASMFPKHAVQSVAGKFLSAFEV